MDSNNDRIDDASVQSGMHDGGAIGRKHADELERVRQANAHTSALLQSILDTAPIMVFWKDADRRFEGANKAFLDFYGFESLDDILGKNDEDMGWHPDPGPYKDDEKRVIEEGVSTHRVPGTCIVRGSVRYIVASKSPRYVDGHVVGLVGAFEDVTLETERTKQIEDLNVSLSKALDEAERANASEQSFLSSVSHDMRTPLNGILGFTQLAINATDVQKKQEYLQKIDLSGKLMLDLVNDVLDLSKIESGKMDLHPRVFEAKGLFDGTIESERLSAERRNISVKANLESAYPQFIYADRMRLEQIALNLLSNAIKYTPDGGSVGFRVAFLDPPVKGCNTLLRVADNGIGMSDEFRTRMFEPFAQEHQAQSYGTQGTGLGLSVVKRIVDLMGGCIEVESALGKGTVFCVYLPVEVAQAEDAVPAEHDDGARDINGKHLLICEDNDLNAEIVQTLVIEQGAKTTWVKNGEEGVKTFAESQPGSYDAILMDVRMPVMTGLEATRAIRALDRADARTIPIIAMTADAFSEDVQHCLDAGMSDHVSKPIDPNHLFAAISRLCAEKR